MEKRESFPLAYAKANEKVEVVKVKGEEEIVKHLHNLGIRKGAIISIVGQQNVGIIIKVQDSRVALNKEFSQYLKDLL